MHNNIIFCKSRLLILNFFKCDLRSPGELNLNISKYMNTLPVHIYIYTSVNPCIKCMECSVTQICASEFCETLWWWWVDGWRGGGGWVAWWWWVGGGVKVGGLCGGGWIYIVILACIYM